MEGGWNRKSVSYCFCAALKYAHAHCPCERCGGKAVSRYTEYKHWKDSKALASASQRISDAPESTDTATSITTTATSTATDVSTATDDTTASTIATDVTLATTCTNTAVTSVNVDPNTARVDQTSTSGITCM